MLVGQELSTPPPGWAGIPVVCAWSSKPRGAQQGGLGGGGSESLEDRLGSFQVPLGAPSTPSLPIPQQLPEVEAVASCFAAPRPQLRLSSQ